MGRKEISEQEEEIIKLRNKGLRNQAIAKTLNLPIQTVGNIAHELIQAGRINRLRRGPEPSSTSSERTATIIRLKRQRKTLEEIGEAMSVTRERARQLSRKIALQRGEGVFTSDPLFWTAAEAAKKLKVPLHVITNLCASGEIKSQRRSEKTASQYLIPTAKMEKFDFIL